MRPPTLLFLPLLPLTTAFLVIETSTSTYTATATSSISSSISSTPASSTTPPSPQYTNTTLFTTAILNTTNAYRTAHSAPPLTWNDSLATTATSLASQCHMTPSDGNQAQGYPNASAAVAAWGREGARYDFRQPRYSAATGNFSQLVWKASRSVGCGRSDCGQGWLVVCEYWPPGNVEGEFGAQVGRALGGWVAEGEGAVGVYFARLAAVVNGGVGRVGGGVGLGFVGVAMLVALGMGM